MQENDLEFIDVIVGRKPHYIFRQSDTYYVMTSLDSNSRGNFFAFSTGEVERVKNRIIERGLTSFHPKQIDLYKFMEIEEYREHRIRCICYVLVSQKEIYIADHGREIHFRTWNRFDSEVVREATERLDHEANRPIAVPPQEYSYYESKKKQLDSNALEQSSENVGGKKKNKKKWGSSNIGKISIVNVKQLRRKSEK
jgi:hypothetical protein